MQDLVGSPSRARYASRANIRWAHGRVTNACVSSFDKGAALDQRFSTGARKDSSLNRAPRSSAWGSPYCSVDSFANVMKFVLNLGESIGRIARGYGGSAC